MVDDHSKPQILLVDFGSQTAHLIARRIQDLGAKVKIIEPEEILKQVQDDTGIKGIILSGGPASVYEKGAPTIDKKIFDLDIPILGICYGWQLTSLLLGGKVINSHKEYGPATIRIMNHESRIMEGLPKEFMVWVSHGDTVVAIPRGFSVLGETESVRFAAVCDVKRKIYGVQFHPEVEHTEHGLLILRNFIEQICQIKTKRQAIYIRSIIAEIRETVGSKRAMAAVSGGLDSTVAATLATRAIGRQLIPVHVDSGLMREGTAQQVEQFFNGKLGITPVIIQAEKEFLKILKRVTDPEEKRRRIGKLYIDLFHKEVKRHGDVGFLVQGTIYSDVIESRGTRHSANIKSHHNVGGLPKNLKLALLEPIRSLYTDQVRELAEKLAIPKEIIHQQPHPGPGFAIRILGEVTAKRLAMIQKADQIVVEEMKKADWYEKVLHSFPILTGAKSTSVRGDGRVYGEVVALRIVTSKDRMTGDWAKVPYQLLQRITSRITSEVTGVSRVVYDITTKPPATMEWE